MRTAALRRGAAALLVALAAALGGAPSTGRAQEGGGVAAGPFPQIAGEAWMGL